MKQAKISLLACHYRTYPGCIKKRRPLNINKYSLCFTAEKTFGPWGFRSIVIVFYRHNYLNKIGCISQLLIEIYNSESS